MPDMLQRIRIGILVNAFPLTKVRSYTLSCVYAHPSSFVIGPATQYMRESGLFAEGLNEGDAGDGTGEMTAGVERLNDCSRQAPPLATAHRVRPVRVRMSGKEWRVHSKTIAYERL